MWYANPTANATELEFERIGKMLIDAILDRKDDEEERDDFFSYDRDKLIDYLDGWYDDVANALKLGDQKKIKMELCSYIDTNEYNPAIKDYINARYW
jgi:hypothetical protein